MAKLIVCGAYVFMGLCFYFSLRKSYEYNGGKIFLVSIPEWEIHDEEVEKIVSTFKKQYRYCFWLCILLSLLALFLDREYYIVLFPLVFLIISAMNYPLRVARAKLLALKKARNWPVNGTVRQIDITIGAHMKESMIRPIWYVIPVCLAVFIYFVTPNHEPFHIIYLVFVCIVPITFYTLVQKMPNRTFCEDSTLNITLNRNRRWMLSVLLMFLMCADTLMFTAVLLLFNEMSTWIVFGLFFIAIVCMLIGVLLFIQESRKWRRLVNGLKDPIYREDEDDYWHYGWFSGPVYNNPNDPEVFKDSEITANMTLNNGRISVKIFYAIIFLGIGCLLGFLFGYPALLDYQKRLVDVEITDEHIVIDSNFYSKQVVLSDIEEVTLLKELPSATRTGGTDTGIYATGNYDMDGYGHVRMYVASRHKPFILIHTKQGIIVFNDDDSKATKKLYEELQARAREEVK